MSQNQNTQNPSFNTNSSLLYVLNVQLNLDAETRYIGRLDEAGDGTFYTKAKSTTPSSKNQFSWNQS